MGDVEAAKSLSRDTVGSGTLENPCACILTLQPSVTADQRPIAPLSDPV